MEIRNITKKTILSKNSEFQNSFRKMQGMLANSAACIVFKTRFGIHTFFMKKYIDVLILDDSKKVVALKKNLAPWNIYLWNPKHDTVIELDSGAIAKSKTEIGDIILFDL